MYKHFSKTILLILLLLASSSWAKEESCYSVQLASLYNKNSIYFNQQAYPSSCKVISLANLKAIRCGCFDDKAEAQASLKKLRKTYRGSILVRTYKSRFKNKPDIAAQEKQRQDGSSPVQLSEETTDTTAQESEQTQEISAIDQKIDSFLHEGELSIQGHIDLTAQGYIQRQDGKHKANLTGSGELELDYSQDDISVVAKLYAQADSHDIQGSSAKNHRSFMRVDELYVRQDFEDDQIMFGKSIRFWGALEARNITDGFNPDDLRSDIFDMDKLGVWNLAYTHYTETGELALIVKLNEQDRKMSSFPYVYYLFPETANNLPLNYDQSLQADQDANRPSFFIKYAGSTDTEYAWDYALIYENGYDSQRYYTYAPSASSTSINANENAYLVNKILTYNTIVVGSTLIKVEGTYTDVISDDLISDYYHIGLGVEHTLTQFNGEADLGLIAEYYNYDTLQGGRYSDLDLFEVNQNDLFIGARYSFNEGNDASIVGGGIFDLDYDEQVYYVEYEGRIAETFKLNLDYRYIEPSSDPTAFNFIGRHQRLSIQAGYYF